jgi:hypothetical protein
MEVDLETYIKQYILEAQGKDIPEKQSIIIEILHCFADSIQAVADNKEITEKNYVYLETLCHKLIFTTSSILNLTSGCLLEVPSKKFKGSIIDNPSIKILIRSAIECLLTIEYLYFDDISEDEKLFRFKLFEHSGLLSRQQYANTFIVKEHREKAHAEKLKIDKLEQEITANPLYHRLPRNKRGVFRKYGVPRIKSWDNLIKESRLSPKVFTKTYTLLSNYAHSEYISLIQINESKHGTADNESINNAKLSLELLRFITSTALKLITEKYTSAKNVFETYPIEFRRHVNIWSNYFNWDKRKNQN